MKKNLLLFSSLLFFGLSDAQILKVNTGSDLTILGGTIFKADSLTLIPSADFTLSDITLIKSAVAIHTPINTYISRVYQFSNNSNPFTGSIEMNYTDGAELNSIPENALTQNIFDGTSWNDYVANTRDATNNFVLTTGLNSVVLNELTLASQLSPLPLTWLSFTATKQNQYVLLQWVTKHEQNTKGFSLQHRSNATSWTTIDYQAALGLSDAGGHYNYIHTNPVNGINYYRITQTDIDGKYSYSDIRSIIFSSADEPFTVLGNPVNNAVLNLKVNTSAILYLYTPEGKLLWQEQVHAGIKTFNVSQYAKGTYLLKANTTTQKILIQ